MIEKAKTTSETKRERISTVVYGKGLALLGILIGAAMVFGTPGIVLGFLEEQREFVESFPSWALPTMLCIGMGGGVLVVVLSVLFGLLIPTTVVRDGSADSTRSS